jgi:putative sigma-54 modulation protein
MDVEFTGRQVAVTKELRALADPFLNRIGKVLGRSTSAHIVLTEEMHRDKQRQIAEVTIKTRLHSIVSVCEATSFESALRQCLEKSESQAIRHKEKVKAKKRLPKAEKVSVEPELERRSSRLAPIVDGSGSMPVNGNGNGKLNGKAATVTPLTVHSFPANAAIVEPHVVRSIDSVALRPMSLEEAVKEAEFRDREVFVFRDPGGQVKVLHRKRDGRMELIELP